METPSDETPIHDNFAHDDRAPSTDVAPSARAAVSPFPGSAKPGSRGSRHRELVRELQSEWQSPATVKATTRAENLAVFKRLRERAFEQRTGANPEAESLITPEVVAQQFIEDTLAGRYTTATFLRYRTALLGELSIAWHTSSDPETADRSRFGIEMLADRQLRAAMRAAAKSARPTVRRTEPEKRIPRREMKLLLDRLHDKGDKARATLVWAQATMITGLRPVEWQTATLLDSSLRARRAKEHNQAPAFARMQAAADLADAPVATAYEANLVLLERLGRLPTDDVESMREIPIAEADLGIIVEHLENVENAMARPDGFAKFYEACRHYLQRTCKELWGDTRRYALYSFRHQFAANAKRTMPLAAVETILGSHSAMKYAPRSASWRRLGTEHPALNEASDELPQEATHAAAVSDKPGEKG